MKRKYVVKKTQLDTKVSTKIMFRFQILDSRVAFFQCIMNLIFFMSAKKQPDERDAFFPLAKEI